MSDGGQTPGTSSALVELNQTMPSIQPDLLRFADPGSAAAYRPSGDYGYARYGGVIYEDVDPRLTGYRWRRTVRLMLTDPVIAGMLRAITMLIRRAEWLMEPAKDGGNAAQEVADFVESCRHDMRGSWPDALAKGLSFLPYGWSILEVVLKRRLGEGSVNRQGVRVNQSAYDDGMIGWDEWAPRAQDTLTRWIFDAWGHVTAVEQQSPNLMGPVEIPLTRCLHFVADDYWGSPEGVSVLRSAYYDWDGIRKIKTTENIGIERDLAGLPVFRVPASLMDPNAQPHVKAAYEEYKRIGTNLRRGDQSVVILPSDVTPETKTPQYDLTLLSTGGQRQIDTSRVIRERTAQMTMSLLADFLTVGHEGSGSYALAQDKTKLFTISLSAWLDLIANVINAQAIRPLVRINGFDTRLTPKLTPGPLDETDLKAIGDFVKAMAPMIDRLNHEDQIAITSHVFNLADWPKPTTTAEDLEQAAEKAHQAERDLLEARKQPPTGDAVADAEDEKAAAKQESDT